MPEETATVIVSLTVKDAAVALEFYANAFGAEELFRMAMPDGTVRHSEIRIGDTTLCVSGGSEEWKASPLPEGTLAPCLFGIHVEDVDEASVRAVDAGIHVIEEPTTQFWGMRTAIVADPFGYRWNLRKLVEEVTPEEVMRRAMEFTGDA